MKCPKCMLPNVETSTHCTLCHTPLQSSTLVLETAQVGTPATYPQGSGVSAMAQTGTPAGTRTCTQCGGRVDAGAKFCLSCGANLGFASAGHAPAPSSTTAGAVPTQPYSMASPSAWAPPARGATVPPAHALIQRMVNISVGMRIAGALLVLLFFGPFVSCGAVEMSGAYIATSAVASSSSGRGSDGDAFWVFLALVPLAGLALLVAGFRAGGQASRNPGTVGSVRGTQIGLVLSLVMLFLTMVVIKLNQAAIFLSLEWAYYASVLVNVSGLALTMIWHNARSLARQLRGP